MGCPQDDNARVLVSKLLGWGQEDFRGRQELYVGDFCGYPDALELAFFAAAPGLKGEQILIVEVLQDFVEVGLQRNLALERHVIGLGAGFLRDLPQIGLGVEDAETSAAELSPAGLV